MSERRQHRLANGERSRGYVPIALEEVDARVSLAALGLLVELRAAADQRESDGVIDEKLVRSVVSVYNFRAGRLAALLAELTNAGLISHGVTSVQDLNFTAWCRTHAERQEAREDWRERQTNSRTSRGDKPERHAVTSDSGPSVSRDTASASASASTSASPRARAREDDAAQKAAEDGRAAAAKFRQVTAAALPGPGKVVPE